MKQVSLKVTTEQYCEVVEIMERTNLSISVVIREMLDRGLSK